jgi:Putative addiction module component
LRAINLSQNKLNQDIQISPEPAMNAATKKIVAQALGLPVSEGEALIDALIVSVRPPAQLHPDWHAEIARRVAELDAGRATLTSSDIAMAQR